MRVTSILREDLRSRMESLRYLTPKRFWIDCNSEASNRCYSALFAPALRVQAKSLWIALTIGLLPACATQHEPARPGVLTIAVAGETILVGQSNPLGTRGTFRLVSITDIPMQCSGQFNYHNMPHGRARFSCANGDKGAVKLLLDGTINGTGKGDSSLGPVQLVFGYSIDQANERLQLPNNLVLVAEDGRVVVQTKDQNSKDDG